MRCESNGLRWTDGLLPAMVIGIVLTVSGCTCGLQKCQPNQGSIENDDGVIPKSRAHQRLKGYLNEALLAEMKSAPGVKDLPYTLLPMTDLGAEPIGTITSPDDGPLSTINRTACKAKATPPDIYYDKFDGTYTISKELAGNIGLDKAISVFSSFKADYDHKVTYTIDLDKSSLRYLTKDELKDLLNSDSCKKVSREGTRVIIVGYVLSKRTLTIQNIDKATANLSIKSLVSVGGTWDPGSQTWTQTDKDQKPVMVVLASLPKETTDVVRSMTLLRSKEATNATAQSLRRIPRLDIQSSPTNVGLARSIRDAVAQDPLIIQNNVEIKGIDTRKNVQEAMPLVPLVRVFRDADMPEALSVQAIVASQYHIDKSIVKVDIFRVSFETAPGRMEIWVPELK